MRIFYSNVFGQKNPSQVLTDHQKHFRSWYVHREIIITVEPRSCFFISGQVLAGPLLHRAWPLDQTTDRQCTVPASAGCAITHPERKRVQQTLHMGHISNFRVLCLNRILWYRTSQIGTAHRRCQEAGSHLGKWPGISISGSLQSDSRAGPPRTLAVRRFDTATCCLLPVPWRSGQGSTSVWTWWLG